MNLSRLTTIAALAALYVVDGRPLFPEATVRDWARTNLREFRERCVVLVGGKKLVDLDALEAWVEDGRGATRQRKERRAPECPVTPASLSLPPFSELLARSHRQAEPVRRRPKGVR